MRRPPPCSPLFPYTTLFRSNPLLVSARISRSYRPRLISKGIERSSFTVLEKSLPKDSGFTEISSIMVLPAVNFRSEEHTSELQSRGHLVCRLLLDKKNQLHP